VTAIRALSHGTPAAQIYDLLRAMRATAAAVEGDDRPLARLVVAATVTQWADDLEAVLARLAPVPGEQP
jgi:hypothetical protein